MTKKAAGKKEEDGLKQVIATFQLDAEQLPQVIDEAAFGSGDYPHKEKLKSKIYQRDLLALQIELLKALNWVQAQGERVAVIFEGRDTAGKGGAIHRFTQHLSPRDVRIVALQKPTPTEQGQWYFQRYASQLPTRGEITIFDRSWYNRGGVEPVMGFCTPEQTDQFLHEAPQFEAMLVRDGIRLFKLFLTIGQAMQLKRLHARHADPLKQWKLSPIDHQAVNKWEAYSSAYDRMLAATDTVDTPWTIVKANDKHRTRLATIRSVLAGLPYPDKDEKLVGGQDHKIVLTAERFLAKGREV
ncbi:polyphosphate kinase 2 [Labrys miyagiensis]|uniref:ADP/GDP-polyphosphate phosphotransferase n=1 Tax=Labrys miyagiensis TaxID=346912 RepID=A0ABQ6CPS8_9HYPH|nr:polyphosphate kinase 2 [Labrys miyagiensis]GLS22348.1 polyphosphate kinase 2 [Labrys miyagiensis]